MPWRPSTPVSIGSTGGSQFADQLPFDYSRPIEILPALGVMNQDAVNNMMGFLSNNDLAKVSMK